MKTHSDWKPETGPPPIYLDFQAMGPGGGNPLWGGKTGQDIEDLGIELQEGMLLNLYCDDSVSDDGRDEIIATGTAHRAPEGRWVVLVEDDDIRYLSDEVDLDTLAQ